MRLGPAAGGGRAAEKRGAKPRLYVLDGLRLLAALAVVFWHYTGYQRHPAMWGGDSSRIVPEFSSWAAYGWSGVELFFLISGFVICMSAWGRTVGEFFVSRVVRLFPAYWVCLLITSAVVLTTRPTWMWNIDRFHYTDVLTNLTMLQNGVGGAMDIDPVYWTLWIELRFYVLFAVLVALGQLTYRRVVMFCAVWTLGAVAAAVSGWAVLDLVFDPEYAPLFIAGIAMYLIHRFGPDLLLWGVVGLNWLLAQHRMLQIVSGYQTDAGHRLSFTLCFGIVSASFLVMIAAALGRLDRIRGRWIVAAGALTYPLYLLHEEIGWLVISELHTRMNPYLLVLSLVGVMLLASWLVHRLVERPLAGVLKRRLTAALERARRIDAGEPEQIWSKAAALTCEPAADPRGAGS
ncbi:acyltransferase [Kitasatospora sp. NBC_01287]|uniref:acyltransferase family protein n=1 Tax=Kitasatospora sp. NBC_01287 TaxID=2903573 RepID=UPI00224DB4B6|nr:acyltransferase [Kitasatospora sp. NBC_01287]MCX4748553.1 acyltransferase [Kitasatospora sp. NBC_01287]